MKNLKELKNKDLLNLLIQKREEINRILEPYNKVFQKVGFDASLQFFLKSEINKLEYDPKYNTLLDEYSEVYDEVIKRMSEIRCIKRK